MVLAPGVLLGLVEIVLRLVGYGYPTAFFQTIEAGGSRIVVQNDQFSRRFFPASLVRHPLPVRFAAQKPEGVYRVFVMGESAAMGDPEPAFAFSRILEVLLRERFPKARFEVINLAFTAINSHVILPIARETAGYQGDLWVIYMGHNEVQGPFGPGTIFGRQRSQLWMVCTVLALKRTRVGQLMDSFATRLKAGNDETTWRGLEMFTQHQFRQDDPAVLSMDAQFRENIEDILHAARGSHAQVILCTAASNLKDSAPFASLHKLALSAEKQAAWEASYQAAAAAQTAGRFQEALASFQACADLDPTFADLQFKIGRCLLALNQPAEARTHLENARDLDTLRFRTDSRLNRIIADTAAAAGTQGVSFCDTVAALEQAAPNQAAGDELFFDHVHLTFEGNYLVARVIAEQVLPLVPSGLRQEDTAAWAASELCARRLGFTGWNQYQMAEVMRRRLAEPPFVNQSNSSERQKRYAERLAELRPSLEPAALDSATQLCRQALARKPDDPHLHNNLARLLTARGDNQAALAEFQRLTELWPQDPAAWNNLGVLYRKLGRPSEAEPFFREALRRRADFADAHHGLGLCQTQRGALEAATRSFRRALDENPNLAEARVDLGALLLRQGKMQAAQEQLIEAVRSRPAYAPGHLALADLLTRQDQLLEAASQLSTAARLQPERALAQARQGVEKAPSDPLAQFQLAAICSGLTQRTEAVQSLETALLLKTNFWEARYLLGVELAGQGQMAEAEQQFAAAVRLQPDSARAHWNWGIVLARQLRLEQAVTQFREVLRLEPTNQVAQQYLQRIQGMRTAPSLPAEH